MLKSYFVLEKKNSLDFEAFFKIRKSGSYKNVSVKRFFGETKSECMTSGLMVFTKNKSNFRCGASHNVLMNDYEQTLFYFGMIKKAFAIRPGTCIEKVSGEIKQKTKKQKTKLKLLFF